MAEAIRTGGNGHRSIGGLKLWDMAGMIASDGACTPAARLAKDLLAEARACWPVILGGLAIAAPTLLHLAQVSWAGTMGPLECAVTVISAALLIHAYPRMLADAQRPPLWLTVPVLGLALALYVIGRVTVYLSVEASAAYAVLLASAYWTFGARSLRANWFPLLYPLLALPIEPSLRPATVGLRLAICQTAVAMLHGLGYAVAGVGQVIFVDSYVVALKDACSGLSSLLSLSAIGLFYVYVHRGACARYCAVSLIVMIALAVCANLARVTILILMTHYLGDAAAQSAFHQVAGLAMFAIALGGVILFDGLTWPLFGQESKRV